MVGANDNLDEWTEAPEDMVAYGQPPLDIEEDEDEKILP